MIIGTPKTSSRTKVLLLGSGELGKELTISLQRFSIEVIAVDRYKNAPAQQVAHSSHTIDMTNPKELLRVIEEEAPNIIIPELEAIAIDLLIDIEKNTDIVITPTAKAIAISMNREKIRQLSSVKLNIPTSKFAFANSLQELKKVFKDINKPCFVKPIMSSSGKGQTLVLREEDLEFAWNQSLSLGRVKTKRVILEEKINFDYEITLLTVRSLNKDDHVITSFCEPIQHRQINGDFVSSWQPAQIDLQVLKRAKEIAAKVTDHLGGLGLFGVEFFIKGSQIWFNEISPRPHDTGMLTMCSQKQSEFDLHVRAILGFPVDTEIHSPAASLVLYGGKDSQNLRYSGMERALLDKDVDIRIFGKIQSYPKRRMGLVMAVSKDTSSALKKVQAAADLLTLY